MRHLLAILWLSASLALAACGISRPPPPKPAPAPAPIAATAPDSGSVISEDYVNPYRYYYYFAALQSAEGESGFGYTKEISDAEANGHIGSDQYRLAFADAPSAPVTVGIVLPLSGKDATLGKAMLNAAMLAIFDIQPDGVGLRVYDTRSSASGTQTAAQSAVRDGVRLILGPIFARNVATVKAIASPQAIPVIAFSNDRQVASSDAYILGLLPEDQIRQVMYAAIRQGKQRFAALLPADKFGDAVTDAINAVARETGARIITIERYQSGIDPLTESVRRLAAQIGAGKGADALAVDAVVIPATGNDLRTITPLLPYFYIDSRRLTLLGTAAWESADVQREAALHGAWFAAPPPEQRRRFEDRYRQNFGSTPPRLASLAYDAMALAAVIGHNAKGDYSRQRLQDPNGFAGIDGIFRFLDNGTAERGLAVFEVSSKGFTVIESAPDRFIRPTLGASSTVNE